MLEDLTYDCKAVSQLQLHDAVLALHRSLSGSLTFGDNIVKALRWASKSFELALPNLYTGMFGGNSLFTQTGEKREAPPLPLAFFVWLETRFLQGIEDVAELMFVGGCASLLLGFLAFFRTPKGSSGAVSFATASASRVGATALKPTSVVRHLLASLAAFFLEIPVMTG